MSIKVKIENFQSIKDIEFSIDRYTVLTGPSNSGKSAICRAIEGALFNRSGDGFVRHGEKHAKVSLLIGDKEIVWTKGSGKNNYTVNGEVYDKVGTDVPNPILEMGFHDVDLSRSKLRPQMGTDQFDILFLIREQGSIISEVFSALGRLDVITKAGKECSTDLKGKKSLLKTRYDDLSAVDKRLLSYNGFEKVVLATESLESDKQEISELQVDIDFLLKAKKDLDEYNSTIDHLGKVKKLSVPKDFDVKALSEVKELVATSSSIKKLTHVEETLTSVTSFDLVDFSEDKLISLVSKLEDIKNRYIKAHSEVSNLEKVSTVEIPEDLDLSDIKKIDSLEKAKIHLQKLLESISNEQSMIDQTVVLISQKEEELHEALGDLEECPLCNQKTVKNYAF